MLKTAAIQYYHQGRHWYLRQRPPVRLALAIVAGASLWMLTGIFNSAPAPAPAATLTPTRVQVIASTATPIERRLVLQGAVEPDRSVDVKAETTGRVTAVPAPKGSTVSTGQLLVQLAMDDRQPRLDQAKALLIQREIEEKSARTLGKTGLQSGNRVAEAKAALETAKANVIAMELDIKRTLIRSPFDGILENRMVEEGDYVTPGTVVARVIDADPLVVKAYVAQDKVTAVPRDGDVRVRLVNGQALPGKIRYLSSEADAVTRTYALEAAIPNPTALPLAGSSVSVEVPLGKVPAHYLSPAFLSLSATGQLGVKTIDAENHVHFNPVTVEHTAPSGIWVSGLPETANIITVGNGFVKAGETVDPTFTPAPDAPLSTASIAPSALPLDTTSDAAELSHAGPH